MLSGRREFDVSTLDPIGGNGPQAVVFLFKVFGDPLPLHSPTSLQTPWSDPEPSDLNQLGVGDLGI